MTNLRVLTVGAPQTFRSEVARALGLSPEDIMWVPTVDAASQALKSEPCNVVVVSPKIEENEALDLAEKVAVSSPTNVVVLVRSQIQNGILPAAMRAGIRDVVDLSQGPEVLHEALERAVNWSTILRAATGTSKPAEGEAGKVFVVYSSKGGTGKSFLSTNLAAALADVSGEETALLDIDLAMGDAFTYYGEESQRPMADILSIGDDADPVRIKNLGAKLADGLWGFGAPPDPAAENVPADAILRVLQSLKSSFAYTVVDVPASYSDHVLTALDVADVVFLLASLDVVGIRHMSKALETVLALGVTEDRISVVLNRADSKVGIEPADVERVLNVVVDSMIPSSVLVPMSLNSGQPVYIAEPKSDVARSIGEIARKAAGTSNGSSGAAPASPEKRRFFKRN